VAARLHKLASERSTSSKSVVDATLRAGLDAGSTAAKPYREVTRSLRVLPGVDLAKALRLAAELEDEETVRPSSSGTREGAIEPGATLNSAERDFGRFVGLH
jgi:hypothetical protein